MPDERLRIVIEAKDKSSATLKGLKKNLDGIGAAGSAANTGLRAGGEALKGIVVGLGIAAAAATAFAVAAKKVYDFGKEGASLGRIRNGFELISGGAEQAASNLDILREVTRGAKSDMELMEGATNIMALGLAEDAEQLGTIVRNVEALGSRFGGTMQIFQLMMSNQSLMRVDSFGLGVEEVTKRITELKDAGMDADKAFKTGVVELMTEKYEQLGGAVEDDALAYERLEAEIKNVTDASKQQLSEAILPMVAGAAEGIKKKRELVAMFGEEAVAMAIIEQQTTGTTQAMDALDSSYLRLTAAAEGGAAMIKLAGDAAGEAAPLTQANADAVASYQKELAGIDLNQLSGLAAGTQDAADAASNMAIAGMEAAAALGEMSMATFVAQQIDILTQAEIAGKISKQELEAATRELLVQSGLLTEAEALAAWQAGQTRDAFYAEKLAADQLAAGLIGIKNGIESIPTYKKVLIEIEERHIQTATGGLGDPYLQHLESAPSNAGGFSGIVSQPTLMRVGEERPERVRVEPTTNHNYDITINTNSDTYAQDIFMAQAMAQ